MGTWVILGVSVLLAAVIVLGVWWVVKTNKSKDVSLARTNMSLERTRSRADKSQARADAYQQVADRMTGLAGDAVAQTGEALHVARQIDKVSVQMDALMYRIADEESQHGRHAHGRDTLDDELGFGDDVEPRSLP